MGRRCLLLLGLWLGRLELHHGDWLACQLLDGGPLLLLVLQVLEQLALVGYLRGGVLVLGTVPCVGRCSCMI